MRVNSFQLIKFCYIQTVPATETKSIGLQADAQLSWFLRATLTVNRVASRRSSCHGFCTPSGLFYRDPKLTSITRTCYHQDNFIVTPNARPSTRTLQKPHHQQYLESHENIKP
jgi:hypothetical protein